MEGVLVSGFMLDARSTVGDALRDSGQELITPYVEVLDRSFLAIPEQGVSAVRSATAALLVCPRALQRRFLHFAREEACGASLLEYMRRRADPQLSEEMRRHSDDERRHTQMYLAAAKYVMPDCEVPHDLDVDAEEELGDAKHMDFREFLASIHLAEVRNVASLTLMLELLGEEIARAPVRKVLLGIRRDELRHVTYTGRHVQTWLRDDPEFKKLLYDLSDTYATNWWADISHILRCLNLAPD